MSALILIGYKDQEAERVNTGRILPPISKDDIYPKAGSLTLRAQPPKFGPECEVAFITTKKEEEELYYANTT